MRSCNHHAVVAMLAGTISLGGLGAAMAGADDGGTHAFFAIPSPGSATGAVETTTPDRAPGATNAAADAQPNASVSRTGVAQERATRPHIAVAMRPHVAVTRLARGTAAPGRQVPHVAVARHEGAHRGVALAHRVTAHGTLHAMHRGPESAGQS